jgi:hypothetical protein
MFEVEIENLLRGVQQQPARFRVVLVDEQKACSDLSRE